MNILHDEDIKYYIKCFIYGMLLFCICGVIFFFFFNKPKENYDIVLLRKNIVYKEEIRVVDLIASIGSHKISKKDILSANTIQFDGIEVSFDSINTNKLGKQKIKAYYSNEEKTCKHFYVNIVDNIKPIIKCDATTVEMKLDEVNEKKFSSLFTIMDNCTEKEKIKLNVSLKEKKYSYDDTVHLLIIATDNSNNVSKKTIKIKIKEKEVIQKKDDKKENPVSSSNNQKPNSNVVEKPTTITPSTNINGNNGGSNQEPVTSPPSKPIVQPQRPKPQNKRFLFSDGYNIETAPSQCQIELFNSGYAGACKPLQDENGIYYGMELIFY